MKKIISIMLVMLVLGSSAICFANDGDIVPVLISEKYETVGKIMEINEDSVDILIGDIVDEFKVESTDGFVKDQTIKLVDSEKEGIKILKPYINTSNVKFTNMGTLIKKELLINDEKLELDVNIKSVDGVLMVPLAEALRSLDYEVTWNNDTQTVEILKGAQFTSLKIGENRYFKNRMAPKELSHEPITIEGRTMVPAEFFYDILGLGLKVDSGNLNISESQMAIHSGYIQSIKYKANDEISITISSKEKSESIEDQMIIHASVDKTYFNRELNKGELINVITPPIMTMSIPGQTGAVVIY